MKMQNETILAKAELLRRVVDANELESLRVKKNLAKNEFLKRHYTKAYEKTLERFKREEMDWELRHDIYS